MEIFFFFGGGGGGVGHMGFRGNGKGSTDYKEGTVENWLPTNFR